MKSHWAISVLEQRTTVNKIDTALPDRGILEHKFFKKSNAKNYKIFPDFVKRFKVNFKNEADDPAKNVIHSLEFVG